VQLSLIDTIVPSDAKWAFTTRRINRRTVAGTSTEFARARPGDVLLARIEEIGHHQKIQLASGRQSVSFVGDVIVAAVGDRYAPDQFEGIAEISADQADLLAAGGVVGRMREAHSRMAPPTRVKPLGLLTDRCGRIVNLDQFALPEAKIPSGVTVIGVFGTSMNAGKTTAAVSMAHGLRKAGYRVAGVKTTGTGAFGDFNAFLDAGIEVYDFTDAGMATTYRAPIARIERAFETLVGSAAAGGAEIVIVEFADGVFQDEIAAILERSGITSRLDAVLFAASDALSAAGGARVLSDYGLAPFAIAGLGGTSPLAAREAERATGLPVLTREQLLCPEQVVLAVPVAERAPVLAVA